MDKDACEEPDRSVASETAVASPGPSRGSESCVISPAKTPRENGEVDEAGEDKATQAWKRACVNDVGVLVNQHIKIFELF